MHGAHEVAHLVERLGGRLDDHVDAVAEHVEVEVGDQGRDLDQRVGAEVEPGHLAVDPDQSFVHARRPPYGVARARLSASAQVRSLRVRP